MSYSLQSLKSYLVAIAVASIVQLMVVNQAYAKAGLEQFGQLPSVRSIAISPNGERVALLREKAGKVFLVVMNIASGEMLGAIDTNKFKARNVFFASDSHVILGVSKTRYLMGYNVGKIEHFNAVVYDIDNRKIRGLLRKTKGIHHLAGVGEVVGINLDEGKLYMPARAEGNSGSYNLYSVNLKTGAGYRYRRGKQATQDWYVGDKGHVLARYDYDQEEQEQRVYSYLKGKKPVLIYSDKRSLPELRIWAATLDEKYLLVTQRSERGFLRLSLQTGELSEVTFDRKGGNVEDLITDVNRRVVAFRYSGLRNSYEFFDKNIDFLYARVEATFPNAVVDFMSSTPDKKRIIVKVSGTKVAPAYYLFDSVSVQLSRLGSQYHGISDDDVGDIRAFTYEARDGLKIPAILTLPSKNSGITSQKNLPLIAFPHGGPSSYDYVRFDWWSQYFASQGYAVLQPNFRGSSGFGRKHKSAGDGQWGLKMQDDVSDGVLHLIEKGIVDPKRVCIMGASYGGYSALAGAAYSPELYRCVISVNGVSDIPYKLQRNKKRYGHDHWFIRYWEKIISKSGFDLNSLKKISPIYAVDAVQAPILLIHGRDDVIVPFEQSKRMHKALKKAEKDSRLIVLKGEDHWLSRSATRLKMLKEIDAFVKEHNPPG